MSEQAQPSKPDGWKRTTLGDALPIRYGKARSEKHGLVREETAVYGSSGVIDTFERALTSGPTLIIGRKGTVGATHYSPEPCWPIDTVYFAESEPDKDLRFFKYPLDHLQLGKMDRSTAVPGLSRDDYNAKEVFVPLVEEQHQIVAEIEKQFTRLQAGVAGLRRVQANLRRYRAAVLKAASEGKLVPTEAGLARQEDRTYETGAHLLERILIERRQNWQGRAQYKEPIVPDPTKLPPLPSGWAWASMRQVGEVQLGRQRAPQHHTGDNMRPYLRVANVFEARIDTRDVKQMNFTATEFERYRLNYGDILLNEGQTPELVGRAAMFRDELVDCCYQKTLLRFRAYEGVPPQYALTVFRSYMHDHRFTRRLSLVEELETVVNANLQRATRLRQSILQRAFVGNRFVKLPV